MDTLIETDPYGLKQLIPGPVHSLHSSETNSNNPYKTPIRWMVMIKEKIDSNENTITLPNDTVVNYTGGCIFDNWYIRNLISNVYSYLQITDARYTLIITNKVIRWVDDNHRYFKFSPLIYFPRTYAHRYVYGQYVDQITCANIVIVTPQIFDASADTSELTNSVLLELRSIYWNNIIIDAFVPSESINNISARYKWVLINERLLSRKDVHNMLDIIIPHSHDLCTNYCEYLLPSVVINNTGEMIGRLIPSCISESDISVLSNSLGILDPLQNSECEVKGGTDEECCVCSYNYNDTDRVRITLPCGHQFCSKCISLSRDIHISCYYCRQLCELIFIPAPRQTTDDIRVNTHKYISAILDELISDKTVLCINDPCYMESISNILSKHTSVTVLNKETISVKDVNSFKDSTTMLLIIPYNVKFELGVSLLFVQRVMIICSPKNSQCYKHLMSFIKQRALDGRSLRVVSFT